MVAIDPGIGKANGRQLELSLENPHFVAFSCFDDYDVVVFHIADTPYQLTVAKTVPRMAKFEMMLINEL